MRQNAVVLRQCYGAHALRIKAFESIASDQPPPTDEMILQQPGAATMLCWQQLPPKARPTILNQANDMIGLTPVPNLRVEIYD
jgi:hypothetical protein